MKWARNLCNNPPFCSRILDNWPLFNCTCISVDVIISRMYSVTLTVVSWNLSYVDLWLWIPTGRDDDKWLYPKVTVLILILSCIYISQDWHHKEAAPHDLECMKEVFGWQWIMGQIVPPSEKAKESLEWNETMIMNVLGVCIDPLIQIWIELINLDKCFIQIHKIQICENLDYIQKFGFKRFGFGKFRFGTIWIQILFRKSDKHLDINSDF